MGNPLDLIYSWQALLVAGVGVAAAQLVKTSVDIVWGHVDVAKNGGGTHGPMVKIQVGKKRRQSNPWVTRVFVPAIPLLACAVFVTLIPVHPPVLDLYIEAMDHKHHMPGWQQSGLVMSWGTLCGQFSSYIFDRTKETIVEVVRSAISKFASKLGAAATAAPDEHEDEGDDEADDGRPE